MKTSPGWLIACTLLSLLFFSGRAAAAIAISVSGSWYESIDENDLTQGAGSDLQDSYTSVSGQVSITISGTAGPGDAWRVDVRKIDDNWETRLCPWVRRTSGGVAGIVNGGDAFQEITDIDQPLFFGSGDVNGITVQLRLTGASVKIDPSAYSTMVYYTVVDIP